MVLTRVDTHPEFAQCPDDHPGFFTVPGSLDLEGHIPLQNLLVSLLSQLRDNFPAKYREVVHTRTNRELLVFKSDKKYRNASCDGTDLMPNGSL